MKRASVLLLYKEFRPLRHWSECPAKSRPHLVKISGSLSYSVQLISKSTTLGNTGVWRHRSWYLTQLFSSTNKGSIQIKARKTHSQNARVPFDGIMCSCIIGNGNEGAFRGRQVISDNRVCVYVCLLHIYSSKTQSNTHPSSGWYNVCIITCICTLVAFGAVLQLEK